MFNANSCPLAETKIIVRYYGILHDIAGKRSEVFTVDGTKNALELVKLISSAHGEKFLNFVFDANKRIRNGLAFAVDGDSVQRSTLSRIKCKDISEFVILPPISGGGPRRMLSNRDC